MPDREFRTIGDVGPIRASADASGVIDWPAGGGSGSAQTVAIAHAYNIIEDTPVKSLDTDFSFTADQLAAATRARITIGSMSVYYAYHAGSQPDIGEGHLISAFDTLIIDGNENINNLKFIGNGNAATTMIYITLEGPAA